MVETTASNLLYLVKGFRHILLAHGIPSDQNGHHALNLSPASTNTYLL